MKTAKQGLSHEEVEIQSGNETLKGDLVLPPNTDAVVIFAHGSGSGRFSPRNRQVAWTINEAGMGTLLFDLLSEREEAIDALTAEFRFNIELLTTRLIAATDWILAAKRGCSCTIGYFGASTGAAAALSAAARRQAKVGAVVSRGGRPDMAEPDLGRVKAPTLLIVGGNDPEVLELNRKAYDMITAPKELSVVPGATHLFEEPGTLEQAAKLASDWFARYLL
ncbi:MAG: dienelactone hydrolase family protein [Deltaproteobacteria bacterium]